jgi:hypothetical protein
MSKFFRLIFASACLFCGAYSRSDAGVVSLELNVVATVTDCSGGTCRIVDRGIPGLLTAQFPPEVIAVFQDNGGDGSLNRIESDFDFTGPPHSSINSSYTPSLFSDPRTTGSIAGLTLQGYSHNPPVSVNNPGFYGGSSGQILERLVNPGQFPFLEWVSVTQASWQYVYIDGILQPNLTWYYQASLSLRIDYPNTGEVRAFSAVDLQDFFEAIKNAPDRYVQGQPMPSFVFNEMIGIADYDIGGWKTHINYQATGRLTNYSVEVPEPWTWTIMFFPAAALAWLRRRHLQSTPTSAISDRCCSSA